MPEPWKPTQNSTYAALDAWFGGEGWKTIDGSEVLVALMEKTLAAAVNADPALKAAVLAAK